MRVRLNSWKEEKIDLITFLGENSISQLNLHANNRRDERVCKRTTDEFNERRAFDSRKNITHISVEIKVSGKCFLWINILCVIIMLLHTWVSISFIPSTARTFVSARESEENLLGFSSATEFEFSSRLSHWNSLARGNRLFSLGCDFSFSHQGWIYIFIPLKISSWAKPGLEKRKIEAAPASKSFSGAILKKAPYLT